MSATPRLRRKHLSADALLHLVRSGFDRIPRRRPPQATLSLADVLMSAFAMFSLKDPSLLAFDRRRGEENLHAIYGIGQVPCDTQMRVVLDDLPPETLRPLFQDVFRQLQRGKALERLAFFRGCYLLSLDGTGYFSSAKIHCPSCLEKVNSRTGRVTYSHQLLAGALVHPDFRAVIPLAPEPILRADGADKNDCERNAAKRFLRKFRREHPHLPVIAVEDGLFANGPHIRELQRQRCHYLLGVKEGGHAYLFGQVRAAEDDDRVGVTVREDRATGVRHCFRYLNGVVLNEANPDLRVNFLECWEVQGEQEEQVRHFSWVTDLEVEPGDVMVLMRGGRARWKIENETFNTLKNQGYQFEHNYGRGQKHLSVVLASLMMLAFLVDQAQQLCDTLFQAVWAKLGTKRLLWDRLRSLFHAFLFPSLRALYEALLYGFERHSPILLTDSS